MCVSMRGGVCVYERRGVCVFTCLGGWDWVCAGGRERVHMCVGGRVCVVYACACVGGCVLVVPTLFTFIHSS